MRGQVELYQLLEKLEIQFEYHEHPPLATIEDAKIHWKNYKSGRCKNIFFRNHKGDRHYLVILEHLRQLNIRDLEKRLKQGKLTFASDSRLKKYDRLTFHPNINTASLVLSKSDFLKFLEYTGNTFEFIRLYE